MNRMIAFFTAVFFSMGVGLASADESMPWENPDQKPLIKSKKSKQEPEKKKKAAPSKKNKKKKI